MTQREDELKRILAAGMAEAAASVPLALLRHYKKMGLTDTETMLLIHLLAFVRHERSELPTVEELAERMTIGLKEVAALLEKLIKLRLLGIDQGVDEVTEVWFERYNLQPLYQSLAEALLKESQVKADNAEPDRVQSAAGGHVQAAKQSWKADTDAAPNDIYTIFEREFARPLTPMELETITGWLEQDRYSEELIMAALKESVFTGKLNFRYIDRILLEWQRNRVQTAEQARVYSQRFRGMRQ